MGERIDTAGQVPAGQAPAAVSTAACSVEGRILQMLRDQQAGAEETNRLQKRVADALDRLRAE